VATPLTSARADPPTPADPAGHVGGLVPSNLDPHAHGAATRGGAQQNAAALFGFGSNLVYHTGGSVMTAKSAPNQVYAIYWSPAGYSIPSSYETLINTFFGDVATASGQTSNVYAIDTQYSQNVSSTTSYIKYSSHFVSSYVDTTPFPANGCTDSYTSVCLTDAQLQAEITIAMSANGWTNGLNKEYFLFTPKGVGSCSGSSCSFSTFCAYHGYFGSGANAVLYANMPYADTVPAACDAGQHPNASIDPDADATINVTSHEHNETITDPLLNAWYDRQGNEIGDKCAWNFGQLSGSAGSEYSQTINNDRYFMQQEWSNKNSGCEQHM
jgi:hypothetical protein